MSRGLACVLGLVLVLAIAPSTIAPSATTPSTVASPRHDTTRATDPRPAAATRAAAHRGSRPNIVLITTDDMRVDDLRAMPFTRRVLARRGVTFTDAISPYPLCCPARAEIVTGQYSHNNGVRGNAWPNGGYWALKRRHNTLPVWLRARGYRTAFVGKYMNQYGAKPLRRAFSLATRPVDEVPPGWSHWYASVQQTYAFHGVELNVSTPAAPPHRVRSSDYQADLFGGLAAWLIGRYHRQRKPFFIWMSQLAPHRAWHDGQWTPPIPAQADRGDFAGTRLPGSRAYRAALNENTSDKHGPMPGLHKQSVPMLRNLHQRRLESLKSVDRAVRRVVRRLRATGEFRHTVIIFTSDNGFALGEHRHVGKDRPYEPSLRVPMIISAPGIKHRYRPDADPDRTARVPYTVTTVDIAATIVAASGARPGRALDGLNMLRPRENPDHRGDDRLVLIESGAKGPRRTATSEWVGVRSNRWTWFGWHARPVGDSLRFGGREMYDRRANPAQTTNIIGRDRHRAVRTRLRRVTQEMHDCRGQACVRGLG